MFLCRNPVPLRSPGAKVDELAPLRAKGPPEISVPPRFALTEGTPDPHARIISTRYRNVNFVSAGAVWSVSMALLEWLKKFEPRAVTRPPPVDEFSQTQRTVDASGDRKVARSNVYAPVWCQHPASCPYVVGVAA